MIEVMGGLNFRKSISLDNLDGNAAYDISGQIGDQFGVLFYGQNSEYEITVTLGQDAELI
jgi:hypothetical protein